MHLISGYGLDGFSDDAFGAVDGGGIEIVDAQVHGEVDQRDRLCLSQSPVHAEPATATATQARNADT